ncbi:MAG: radical SAM protein [Planctomycetota bacterium]
MASETAPARPAREVTEHVYYSMTKSLCGACKEPVDAKILLGDGGVWLEKFCPRHGKQSVRVASSIEWYIDSLSFLSPARPPKQSTKGVSLGCPLDCGPCASHQQKLCLPVIPITSACNMDCPVCYTINRNDDAHNLTREGMKGILDRLRERHEDLDIINFTGGEPTLHPELPGFLKMSRDAGIRRLTVSTNGLKLLDEAYVRTLAALDVRIVLSLDTFDPETDRTLLGADTVGAKLKVLDLLEKHGVSTTILPAVAKGLNDKDIPGLLELTLAKPHVRSLELHTLAFTGQGGVGFARDARITIPDVHRIVEEATGGRIGWRDFVPSPLAHPHCYSICYLLCLDGGGYVPFTRLTSRRKLFELLGDSLYIEPRQKLEDVFREVIDDLWASPDRLPESEAVLSTLKRLLEEMFPPGGSTVPILERQKIAERSSKAIYIHSHMDEETFDVSRIMKCCVGVPEADGTVIPTCAYNVLYREKDQRFAGPRMLQRMRDARESIRADRRPVPHQEAGGEAPLKVRPALTGVAEGQAPLKVRPALTGVAEGQAPPEARSTSTGVDNGVRLSPVDQEFIGTPDARAGEVFHSFSRGICPRCRALVDASRIVRGGKVYLRKQCPKHGKTEALISGDSDWFLRMFAFTRAGSIPLGFSTALARGCPTDCGLCPDHEQHTCLPIIEITNHCNLECPICIVQNRNNYHMDREAFVAVVDGLIEKEGVVDTINLSGGEPALHPEFLDLLDLANRPQVARLSVSTNGLRIASDYDLCLELARRKVYVNLQLDAPGDAELRELRGRGDLAAVKQKALANLERAGVRTTIIATVAKGINDSKIGDCIKLLYEREFILSLLFQPAAYTGYGGGCFRPHDPSDVLTIPDVIRCAEEQTSGALRKSDFLPLPCSHPACFGLTYLLKTDSGFVPFPRFLELGRYLDAITNRGAIRPDEGFEEAMRETINELWSGSGQIPDSSRILCALKKALRLMYPAGRALDLEERLKVGEGLVKTIFIHAYMDEHTFEVDRVKKCCTHYALPDGRLMPGCAYNMFFRRGDPRFVGPRRKAVVWDGEVAGPSRADPGVRKRRAAPRTSAATGDQHGS